MAIEVHSPKRSAASRFSVRLLRPLWIGLAAAVLATVAVALLHQQFKSRVEASAAKQFHDNVVRLKAGETKSLLLFLTEDTDSLLTEIEE